MGSKSLRSVQDISALSIVRYLCVLFRHFMESSVQDTTTSYFPQTMMSLILKLMGKIFATTHLNFQTISPFFDHLMGNKSLRSVADIAAISIV